MPDKSHLAFTINENGARPDRIRLRDLLFFLEKLESAIASTAEYMGQDKGSIDVSLTVVREGSAIYDMSANGGAVDAAERISYAIVNRSSEGLPQSAVHSLTEMQKRAFKLGHSLGLNNGRFSAEIVPSVPLFSDALVNGSTTLYAYLNAVGGVQPTAKLVLPGDKRFTAEVPTKEFAQVLVQSLYSYVTLEGEAWWHASSMELRRFRIRRIGEYEHSLANPTDAFAALRELSAGVWDDVDPDSYVREQRD